MAERGLAGIIQVQINGELFAAAGDFTYNIGQPKRETLVGATEIDGFSETPQPAVLEGTFRDKPELDLQGLLNITDATITLNLRNGKTIVFREAFFVGDGNVNTGNAEIEVVFNAKSAEEV